MAYKVIFTEAAIADLEQIVRYIARDDPPAAERMGTRLLDQAETLHALPHRGKAIRLREGVRRLVVPPYLLLYRVIESNGSVEVLRFWHGARDQQDLTLG